MQNETNQLEVKNVDKNHQINIEDNIMPNPMKILNLVKIMQEKNCTTHNLALAANVSPTSIARLRAGEAVSSVTVTNILSALENNTFQRKKTGINSKQTKGIKICKWCGGEIIRKRKSQSEWNAVTTCSRSCSSYYKIHKCKKEDSIICQENTIKFCISCNTQLVRREKEHLSAWLKRQSCNKSCAVKATGFIKPPIVVSQTEHEHLHVKHYIPGTPEFEAIAKQYLERR